MAGAKPEYLSVTQLTTLLNGTLESEYPKVPFCGEISELSLWNSGHLYFTLKDPTSQVSAVMWRSQVSALSFKPKPGDSVQCLGRPNIYPKNGRFQMIVHAMQPAGEGLLQKKFLELKAKLEKEGLFEPARKRALPFLPRAIGIVTSAQGAVIHDIMVRLRERMPGVPVYLVDVKVQGPGAAEQIAEGVGLLNQQRDIEVVIVARGGGSLEDLWAFNEEVVVRAIFASRVPVISGIGHEVDVTLSDLVADVRAPTPTAAAEIAVPRRDELLACISEFERRLQDVDRWFQPLVQSVDECAARLARCVEHIVNRAQLTLAAGEARLKNIHPSKVLAALQARLDSLAQSLRGAGAQQLVSAQQRLDSFENRLQRALPQQKLTMLTERILALENRASSATAQQIERSRQRVVALEEQLRALDPRRVLERGFALVRDERGALVQHASQLTVDQTLDVSFARGAVRTKVSEIL